MKRKTIQRILWISAMGLLSASMVQASCPCENGTQPWAGQDACGNNVCDPDDIGTYPYTDACGNPTCYPEMDGEYPVDCNGDGTGDVCETEDCPVVVSFELVNYNKNENDTLVLGDFNVVTAPEGSPVELSGDLVVTPGLLNVTAKASNYDSGKTIEIPVVNISNVELHSFTFDNNSDYFNVSGEYQGPSSAKLEIDSIYSVCNSTCSHQLQNGSFDYDAEISNMQSAGIWQLIVGIAGVGSAIYVAGQEVYNYQFGDIPATASDQSTVLQLNTSNSNYIPMHTSTLAEVQYGGYGRKRWNGFAYVKKNSFYGFQIPAPNDVLHLPTNEHIKVFTGAGYLSTADAWEHSTPKEEPTAFVNTIQEHTSLRSDYPIYASLYIYQIPDWNDAWGEDSYKQFYATVDFYNPI